jgi:hypothetical protein
MKTSRLLTGAIAMASFGTLLISSCQKGISTEAVPANKSDLSVYMTDGPNSFFDKVLVDIQTIAVKVDTASDSLKVGYHTRIRPEGAAVQYADWVDAHSVWDTLSIAPGEYNLLDFANGADTLLSSSNIHKGRIIAFRLTLGSNNELVKGSVNYPLNLWPGTQNVFIRIFGDQCDEWATNRYRFWIDFDAGRSIVRVNNGEFFLRTVLRAFTISNTGSIEGRVLPISAYPIVSVFSGLDSLYALPNLAGAFKVMGLPDTTYSVFFNASQGYQDTTITGVKVNGDAVHLGTITLHQ